MSVEHIYIYMNKYLGMNVCTCIYIHTVCTYIYSQTTSSIIHKSLSLKNKIDDGGFGSVASISQSPPSVIVNLVSQCWWNWVWLWNWCVGVNKTECDLEFGGLLAEELAHYSTQTHHTHFYKSSNPKCI